MPKLDFSSIDLYLGQRINQRLYGLVTILNFKPQLVAAFQVKSHYSEPASLDIIKFSVQKLVEYIRIVSPNRVDLNFPGIGYGRLDEADVLPLLLELPDCVHIWRFE